MPTILEAYPDGVFAKTVYWDDVEGSGAEQYDESFLSALRDDLKQAEESDVKLCIVPMRCSQKATFWASKPLGDTDASKIQDVELFKQFTACMVHTARRIKDCKAVCGFALPDFTLDWSLLCEADKCKDYEKQFIDAFQKKHAHYVFVRQ